MKNLVIVKLGGSIITYKNKPFTANHWVIEALAGEIAEARKEGKNLRLIVANGGGSFPHVPAAKYKVHKGILGKATCRGMAEVQSAAARLNRYVVDALIEAGENAVSISPFSCSTAHRCRIREWHIEPIKTLLKHDMIPVPYGDVAIDMKQGCCILSTEEIIFHLATKLKAERVVVATTVDGVFTADPHAGGNAEWIPEISAKNFGKIKKQLGGSRYTDITGGMLHKVERLVELARKGVPSEVMNGLRKGDLKAAILGKRCTGTKIVE